MGCHSSKAAQEAAASVPSVPEKAVVEDEFDESKMRENTDDSAASTDCTQKLEPATPLTCKSSSSSQSNCGSSPGSSVSGRVRKQEHAVARSSRKLDMMVTQFIAHEHVAEGRCCKDMHFKIAGALDMVPIDVRVSVQDKDVHGHEVHIDSYGKVVFPIDGANTWATLHQDFHYEWAFSCAMHRGNRGNEFEMFTPRHPNFGRTWLPATIIDENKDGTFEVVVQWPDMNGQVAEVRYPCIDKSHLRDAASKETLAIHEEYFKLSIPQRTPMLAAINRSNGEHMTKCFGRPSPSPGREKSKVTFQVAQDKDLVRANVGHFVFADFMSGEVRAVMEESQRLMHSWTIQIGPLVEHKITVVKHATLLKVITLMVDDEVFIEAAAAELACIKDEWLCTFQLVGEHVVDFAQPNPNADTGASDETSCVVNRRRYVHKFAILIKNEWDLRSAQCLADGATFAQLPRKRLNRSTTEPKLAMETRALQHIYGIRPPAPYQAGRHEPLSTVFVARPSPKFVDQKVATQASLFQSCSLGSHVDEQALEYDGNSVVRI
jgi:hypothetical protein